ncbi:uncharacterized protein LOC106780705 isoform X2 [Vigna radiata var. radiata]|uniref:Uncharacterized protein LOC106780705 isoform X2 n=1 Tax=Vigna radiata var. radiata TaxID=3916 RepID=A0A1S3W1N6_VIGRR|nr:uncharacterized protein LOC106780705 isoform X2 [Vigna radiata var. radiata]
MGSLTVIIEGMESSALLKEFPVTGLLILEVGRDLLGREKVLLVVTEHSRCDGYYLSACRFRQSYCCSLSHACRCFHMPCLEFGWSEYAVCSKWEVPDSSFVGAS